MVWRCIIRHSFLKNFKKAALWSLVSYTELGYKTLWERSGRIYIGQTLRIETGRETMQSLKNKFDDRIGSVKVLTSYQHIIWPPKLCNYVKIRYIPAIKR